MSDMQMNGFHGEELLIQDENFPVHLMSRLNKLREGVKFCDVTLVVGQHDVPAHKCILVSCSPYLFDLFSQEEKSGVTRGACKLKGIEFTSFEYLLNYMYTGKMVIPAEEVKNVYGTARKLKMEEIAKQCVAFLADNLTPANCLGIRSYAQDVEMKKKVDEYIKVNFNDVIVSKNFYGLPNLQVEVVGADEDLLESSQQSHLFELLLIYVKEHQNTKKFKLERLIEQLNVLYLTRDNTLQDCKDFEDKSLKEDEGVQDYRKLKRKQHGHIKANPNKNGQTSGTNNNRVNSLPFQNFTIVKDKSVLEREWKIIAFKETADNTYISISIFNGCLTTISLHCRVARQSPSNSISDTPDSPVHSVSDVQFERSRSLTPLKSMSTHRCGFGLRAAGDTLIASGGYDRGECMKSTECFDIESNTWRILADMNTARGRFSTARMGNMIYACGGSNGLQELRSVEVYDPKKDLWSFVAPISKDRSSPGCAVLNDKLYCIGECMGQDSIAGCEVYDPKTDSSSDIAPIQTARYHYDSDSDVGYNMTLSKIGNTHLGLGIARYVRGSQKKTQFKVVAVDGDYTLWEGECAQAEVKLNEGNIAFQKYLLNLKQSGMLLVLLGKNENGDVMDVFRNRPENMVLNEDDFVCIKANWEKKHLNITETAMFLNLELDSFVFIDDNIFECEEMLRNCPSVLTLMYPGDAKLTSPFLASLWMLDNFNITDESAARTELYRNEITRQEDLRSVRQESPSLTDSNAGGLTRVLRDWEMKMVILKTTIKELKLHQSIFLRVSELLHRTNQFKLNDVHTDIHQFSEKQKIWIVSLKDTRGTYGIISVCVLEEENGKPLQLIQRLISCRALNRQVENRIFYELCLPHTSASNELQIQINTTKRNTPMIKFLHDLDPTLNVNAELGKQHIKVTPKINLNLHSVHGTIHFDDLDVDLPKKRLHEPILTKPGEAELDSYHLIKHIYTAWTPLLQDQASKHQMFPIIPHCQYLDIDTSTNTSLVDTLTNTWMDVLNSTIVPDNDSNFLEQGGTSFTAVFLVSKLRRLHNINISIKDLLKNPNFGVFMKLVLSANMITETKCEPRTNNSNEGNISNAHQNMIVMQESSPLSTSYVETVVVVTDRPVDANETVHALLRIHPTLTSKIKAVQNQQSFYMTYDPEMKVDVTEEQASCDDIAEYISDTIPVIQVLSSPLAVFRKITYRNQTFMVVHVHHIICDEVTLSSIKETVANILKQSVQGQVEDGDAYQLYLQFEQDYRNSNQFTEDGCFWQKLYLTIPPPSTLSNLPEGQSLFNDSRVYQAKHHFANLPNEALGLIKELKLTEFQYYLACSVIVLQRYLGTEELSLAVPVTTRSFQFMKSGGLFVNTIIPKFTIDGNVCLVENVKHIAETWLQAMNHSHYPLEELSRYLWQQHNQSFSSFCNVMFNYVCGASNTSLNIPAKHAKMPLTINFIQGQNTNKTQLWIEWATELIPDSTAKRFSASIVDLIAQSRNELETPLYQAPTLSKSETQLIQSFSQSRIPQDYNEVPCHITFENHAQLHGNEIAIICDGRSLTYQELNSKGNKIAVGILNTVHPEDLKKKPVVLFMKKGEEAIASILGTWKAGGHFLPVSISNRSTIKNIYQRADPALAITTEDIDSLVKDFGSSTFPVLSVDDVSGESDHKYVIEQSIEDIAYVIRTSGSTGTPKQCKVSHRSLQIMSAAWKEVYKMDKFKVNILQWAPLSFDVFVGDLARALVAVPGTMVICSDERRLDISCILNLIKTNKISLVEVTPHFGQQIVENADIGDLDSLQILILGSDIVKSHLFTRVKSQLKPNQRLINSYGMTEATIDSACYEGEPPVTRSGTVPIGKPLPGVKLHILNPKTLQPCPVGTVGELYIGGEILASGDVEVIQVNGLDTKNLKTGDSACWLPSGDIELLGRLDNVMKLRGFRISSTEIENKIISKNPEIKSVCVTPVTSENDVEFLCAFVVLNGEKDGGITKKTLGDRIKGDLPYYMIPDVVHIIKEIPLTTNGKVNIKALPTLPNLFGASQKHTQVHKSKSSSLSTLKGLFTEAMCLADTDDVDTQQTFMEQGGHSLILLRFSTLIKQHTDYTISIADIFSYPSLSTLSRFIDEN